MVRIYNCTANVNLFNVLHKVNYSKWVYIMKNKKVISSPKSSLCTWVAALITGITLTTAAQLPVTDGLVVWLKADAIDINDTVNQVRIDGNDIYVKQWNDQSGGSHHAANTSVGDQPLYIASGLNEKPVLRFAQDNDNDGDRLYLGDLSALFPTAGSLFVVATLDNDGRYNLFGNRGQR